MIEDQDDRGYWEQKKVLETTGTNLEPEGIIVDWLNMATKVNRIKDNARVLDLGCGPGRFIKAMRVYMKKDWSILGIDGSGGMIRIAKKNLEGLRRIGLKHINASDMEFKEEFDLVWHCTVLQHISGKNKRIIIPKIVDALKPGGFLMFFEGTREENDNLFKVGPREWWIKLFQDAGLVHTTNGEPQESHNGHCFYIFKKDGI